MRNHNNTDYVWRNPNPNLTVTMKKSVSGGRCYSITAYEVVSRLPLSLKQLEVLRSAGFISDGQSAVIKQQLGEGKSVDVPSKLDWKTSKNVVSSYVIEVPCTMVDRRTGEVVPGEAINPYSGLAYANMELPMYVYTIDVHCDSSD